MLSVNSVKYGCLQLIVTMYMEKQMMCCRMTSPIQWGSSALLHRVKIKLAAHKEKQHHLRHGPYIDPLCSLCSKKNSKHRH